MATHDVGRLSIERNFSCILITNVWLKILLIIDRIVSIKESGMVAYLERWQKNYFTNNKEGKQKGKGNLGH
jgi:hypothetical protein